MTAMGTSTPLSPTPEIFGAREADAVLRALQSLTPLMARLGFAAVSRWTCRPSVYPEEYRLASRYGPKRRGEFFLGRQAMRDALTGIGVQAAAIGMHGAKPALPASCTGSLSHSRGIAVALAAPSAGYQAVGIDLELNQLPVSAAHLVLANDELEWIGDELTEARLIAAFSAKEAAFKAMSSLPGPAPAQLREIRLQAVPGGFTAAGRRLADRPLSVQVRSIPHGVLSWTVVKKRTQPHRERHQAAH
jgi:4'-phosphopantetheinyl transferase EntD